MVFIIFLVQFHNSKTENNSLSFCGSEKKIACGTYHFPGLSFPNSFSLKKKPAALIIFLGYHFAGSSCYNFDWKSLSFSWVIIFLGTFLKFRRADLSFSWVIIFPGKVCSVFYLTNDENLGILKLFSKNSPLVSQHLKTRGGDSC